MPRSTIVALYLALIAFSPQASGQEKTVILFGAAHSSKAVMQRCYPGLRVIPYSEGEQAWPQLVKEINGAPGRKYVVAGHSSASVFAERVGRKITRPAQMRLVLLDGYGANDVQRRVETDCWYARGPQGQESLNASSMKRQGGACNQRLSRTYALKAEHCRTSWCLHFALVNRNAPAELAVGSWASRGYENCRPFLDWIDPPQDR